MAPQLQAAARIKRVARLAARGWTRGRIAHAIGCALRTVDTVLAKPECQAEVERLLAATDGEVQELLLEGERAAAATLRDALDATDEDGHPNWEVRIKAAVRFLDAAGRRGKPADTVEQKTLMLTGDAAQAALLNALRDPGVRAWLDGQPALKRELLPAVPADNGDSPSAEP